jgi:endoglucanase
MKSYLSAFAVLSTCVLAACAADGNATDNVDPASATTGNDDGDTTLPTQTTTGDEVTVPATPPTPRSFAERGRTGNGAEAPAPTSPPTTTPAPAPAPAPVPAGTMPHRGINLSGGEFGSAVPGAFNKDYTFPTTAEVDYYMSKGMTTFRVGFLWERIQTSAYAELDTAYASRLEAIVKYATSKGANVIIEPHNFARYKGNTVGSSQVTNAVFADFWKRVGGRYSGDAKVMFNLVNEPHDINSELWVGAANAASAAIRGAGAHNTIVVPGNGWTGAHAWDSTSYGTPNSVALLKIADSENNLIFEAHQYLDGDSSGGSGTCISSTIGSQRLAPFVNWLRKYGKKGMIGEFAGGDNATCTAALNDMLTYMSAQSDVLTGWQWWGGGPWWGEYKFTLEPTGGKDRPQMALLLPHLD